MRTAFPTLLLKLSLALMLLLAVASTSRADDEAAVRSVIESQLDAFAADQGSAAYSFAAPIVQQVFPTVEQFMAMVKNGYKPVYRNTAREFQELKPDGLGRPSMRVILTDEQGQRWEALYAMEKQADGTWKIAGCIILRLPSQEV